MSVKNISKGDKVMHGDDVRLYFNHFLVDKNNIIVFYSLNDFFIYFLKRFIKLLILILISPFIFIFLSDCFLKNIDIQDMSSIFKDLYYVNKNKVRVHKKKDDLK